MTVMRNVSISWLGLCSIIAIASVPGCANRGAPVLPAAIQDVGTCTGVFPSYWQDPAPKFRGMWSGQTISNTPPGYWDGPIFRLSDAFPREPVDDRNDQRWRDDRFDDLFDYSTDHTTKSELAREYAWVVMEYIQAGNIGSGDVNTDWSICNNEIRKWFHMPFQTYEVLSGREFVHGLTREAPVTFSVRQTDGSDQQKGTMWAVAFFNETAAYTLGKVWQANGTAKVPTGNVTFDEGSVVGKLLFNTSTPEQLPMLENMPAWTANISDPSFCKCTPSSGDRCTMIEESEQCPRSMQNGKVRLLQFDIAVKDSRAPVTEWVFGTFVADGQRKADEANPWDRISPLGLMWGNDPPPEGQLAHAYPADPRTNGFAEQVIFWDTVDMLNAVGGEDKTQWPGHLGCNSRLNGPADNANSSCMSCHMTASVPDMNRHTPPIIAQFGSQFGPITHECVTPDASDPSKGVDAVGEEATVVNGISFAALDGLYFANTHAGAPVNMTVRKNDEDVNVLAPLPQYADGSGQWLALDFSLQLSISLVQWMEWQDDRMKPAAAAQQTFTGRLPAR